MGLTFNRQSYHLIETLTATSAIVFAVNEVYIGNIGTVWQTAVRKHSFVSISLRYL